MAGSAEHNAFDLERGENVDGNAPTPAGSLSLYRNGLLQSVGVDYTMNGSAVTFLPGSVPRTGDVVSAYYRKPGIAPPAAFVDFEVPIGTIDGANLNFQLIYAPAPAASLKLYKNGVLLNQTSDYAIAGTNVIFANAAVSPQAGDLLIASYRH